MKPQLARGELRCIGATTLDEYRKYIEKDPALERRFQQVCCYHVHAAAVHIRSFVLRHVHVSSSPESADMYPCGCS